MKGKTKMLYKIMAVVFLLDLAQVAQASLMSMANCGPFGAESGTAAADCRGSYDAGNYWTASSAATVEAAYGSVQVTAVSTWAFGGRCGACQPDVAASGGFSQSATFEGSGQGTLLVTFSAYSFDEALSSFRGYLSVDGAQYADRYGPTTVTIPITFGFPVVIGGFQSAFGSDNESILFGLASFSLIDMKAIDAAGHEVGDYPGLVQAAVVEYGPEGYARTPEPGTWLLVGAGVFLVVRRAEKKTS